MEHQRRNHDEELSGLLQYLFITIRKYDIRMVSKQLNMEYNDLYAYIAGNRTMPPTLLVKLTVVTGDKIFFDTIFAGTNMKLEFVKNTHPHTNNIIVESLEAFATTSELASTLKEVVKKKGLDQAVRMKVATQAAMAIQELKDVFHLVNSPEAAV